MMSSYTPGALEFAVSCDRVAEIGVCMFSHGRACPRGLAAWRAGRHVGPGVREACLRKGRLLREREGLIAGRLARL